MKDPGEQVVATSVRRAGLVESSSGEMVVQYVASKGYKAATPWNQLETGILFGLGLPLFVLREDGIEGGIFDIGSADIIIHSMPMPGPTWDPSRSRAGELKNPAAEEGFKQALLRWQSMVSNHYYGGSQ